MERKLRVRREQSSLNTDPTIPRRRRRRRRGNGAIIISFMCCCIIPTALAFISPSQNCDVLSIDSSARRIQNNLKKIPSVARTFPSSSSSSTIISSTTATQSSTTALFGIKGFRSWFQDQFPNAVRHVDVDKFQDKFDHVLVDMNQILHVILRRSRNQEQVTKTLMFELDLLVSRCNPTQSLVLAIDGSPAAAKLATQRKRRFAILKNTQFKLKHSDKLRMTKRQRARRKRNYKAELQSLQLTPGTDCMQNMESVLLYWAWQRLQTQGKPHSKLLPKVRIYISSSLVPGEGEIKLLEWINNYRGHLSTKPGQSIALIGGDADLLLEAMVIPPSWTHNVFVLRPEEADNNSKAKIKAKKQPAEKSTKHSKNGSNNNNNRWSGRKDNIMHCTSLWEMTLSLDDYCRKNISKKYYDPENNPDDQNLLLQIRTDMVLLFMLNGNDYLPRVVAVGFRGVLRTYLALLEQWIETKRTNQNIGLVDPNTLKFNSDFCSDFFHILGRDAPTEQERLRSAMQTKRKTYHSIVNDMSAIGFLPAPVRFQIIDNDGTNQQGEVENDTQAQTEEEDDDDYDDDDDDDDDTVDDEEDFEVDDYDDDEDDDLDSDDSLSEENDIASNDESDDEMDMMQLSLGKINSNDYHEYQIPVNAGSSKGKTKAKNSLARIVLDEFKLLEFVESEGDITKLDYEWEITVPAAANLDRYLGGLLWTLQTYQDGVCPSFSYNYGKCMAPTGRTIAAYFDQAIHDKRDVGTEELLQNFEPGGSISAGVACLAALPVSVKDLVPKPYSLIADEAVEDFYSQCMDPVDNFFYFKKFEELVDAEVKRITKDGLNSEDAKDADIDALPGRRIILGDHYWTVLKRGKEAMEHPFRPPSPPTENFSKLRPNSRITASRIISMDRPPPRSSNTKNATKSDERPSKTRYPRKFWVKNMIDIDHLNFGSLINGSESSSVSKIPYKIAFGSSPDMYGGSRQANDKTSFKLLNSSPVDVLYKQSTVDGNGQTAEIAISTPLPTPILNPEHQSALVILKQLCDIQLVGCYAFDESPNHEITLTIAKPDEINGILPVENLSFTRIKENSQTEQSVKQCLASLALDSMMHSGGMKDEKEPRVRWYDLTFQGMKDFLELHHSGPAVAKKSNVDTNLENQSALVILKQLCDIGIVQYYEFNEVPGSSDHPEKTSLFLYKASSPENSSEEEVPFLSFKRNRTTESKKWVRQHLVSLALDEMILNGITTDNKGGDNLTKTHWYDLTFEGIKERICLHQ
jgi:5'-3' exonuclease